MTSTVAIKERPILMHARSIRGILEGRKTQTRRIIKHLKDTSSLSTIRRVDDGEFLLERWPEQSRMFGNFGRCERVRCPYGQPGDRLWIKETYAFIDNSHLGEASYFEYRADTDGKEFAGQWPPETKDDPDRPRWKSGRFMPRSASRLTLEITGIRVERVQDISIEDAIAEGVSYAELTKRPDALHQAQFADLWDDTNGKGAWEQNDWVWVVEFRKV